MQITLETDYAVRCVLHLARQPKRKATSAQIAAATHVPRVFLAKILQKLARAGIVLSQRGVQGGFQLTRDPAGISLLDAVAAVQGPVSLNRCTAPAGRCSLSSTCVVHPVWAALSTRLARDLAKQSFRKLLLQEKRRGIMRKGGRTCPSTPTTRKQ